MKWRLVSLCVLTVFLTVTFGTSLRVQARALKSEKKMVNDVYGK